MSQSTEALPVGTEVLIVPFPIAEPGVLYVGTIVSPRALVRVGRGSFVEMSGLGYHVRFDYSSAKGEPRTATLVMLEGEVEA